MLTVACVLKSGGIYDADWVTKLKRGVRRHLSIPHKFVCLSDVDIPMSRIPLVNNWPGWWSKIELFRPGIFSGPVLYLDLDTVIVGSLKEIAEYPHTFTTAHEFYRPDQVCSTAMAWNGEFGIYEAFAKNSDFYMNKYDGKNLRSTGYIGDQAFIEHHLKSNGVKVEMFKDLFGPKSVASYKVHRCFAAPPKGASIVAFHGRPKPHQLNDGWVAETWR